MIPAVDDLLVFKGVDFSRSFFDGPIAAVRREPATHDGFEWICLEVAGGGQIQILTGSPLVWIEPERH